MKYKDIYERLLKKANLPDFADLASQTIWSPAPKAKPSYSSVLNTPQSHIKNSLGLLNFLGAKPIQGEAGGMYGIKTHPKTLYTKIYGGTPAANDAVRKRYLYAQRNRARLAGESYNPANHYDIDYHRIANPNRFHAGATAVNPHPKDTALMYRTKPLAGVDTSNRAYAATPHRHPGALGTHYWGLQQFSGFLPLGDSPYIGLHLLAHNLARSADPAIGTLTSPRIIPSAPQGDAGTRMMYAPASADFSLADKALWHPGAAYLNSMTLGGAALNQLFGHAAHKGKFLKNWEQLRNWLQEQKIIGTDLDGLPTLRPDEDWKNKHPHLDFIHSGLNGIMQMLRYLQTLEQKKARGIGLSPAELKDLIEGRRRLNALSLVADNRRRTFNPSYIGSDTQNA